MVRKITYITFHNWETKRQGGFHKFAEYTCKQGIETIFFSFSRPYYIFFKKDERLNKNALKLLCKGEKYELNGRFLFNLTWPTLALPNPLYKIFPRSVQWWLQQHSLMSFDKIAKKMEGTDCFVFESCEGIILLDKIKKHFPNAKIIYRPSDPMMIKGVSSDIVLIEKKMLESSDMNLIVNIEGVELYKQNIPDFENKCKYIIMPNGVDYEAFTKSYPAPECLQKEKTALYVGALGVNWPLVLESAKKIPEINFVIVSPKMPHGKYKKQIKKISNITFVAGINPSDVPAWVSNCNVIIVPYAKDQYEKIPWGITAKYYQAMAAGKPIVAYNDTKLLKDLGIAVAYTHTEFIQFIQEAIILSKVDYSFDIKNRNWIHICNIFLNTINNL